MLAQNGSDGWEFLLWMWVILIFGCMLYWHYKGVVQKADERQEEASRKRLIKEIDNHESDRDNPKNR